MRSLTRPRTQSVQGGESERRIGVVTLNFNQGEFLLEAVKSLQDQSFQNWRLIIVDPGSTDGSQAIYTMPRIADDPRIQICCEPDDGPADGLNRGFQKLDNIAYGYYLNADDRVLEGAFAEVVEYFDRAPEADIVLGHGWLVDRYGRRLRRIFSDNFHAYDYLDGLCVAVQQSTFFRIEVFGKVNGFSTQSPGAWDAEMLLTAHMADCKIHTVDRYWGEFRIYPGTITAGAENIESDRLRREFLREELLNGYRRNRIDVIRRSVARRLRHPVRTGYALGLRLRGRATMTQLAGSDEPVK